MLINKDVEVYAKKADEAFDSNNYNELKEISNECYKLLKSPKYSELDKAILSYHAATSYSNYIGILHRGLLKYLEDGNNESDFEFCILLFRKSLGFFSSFYKNNNALESSSEKEKQYYLTYLNMAQTNYANQLFQCGRLLVSIQQLKLGTDDEFPMAAGNMACKLISYAEYDYDKGHREIFCNKAYQLLLTALEKKLPEEASSYFEGQKKRLEKYFQLDFLNTPYKFNEMALGETEEEKNYKKWCLQNKLFLNTLNDVFDYSLVAHDCIHLPNIVTDIHVGVKFHGLFNQLKQEYVSARYMIYDGISNRSEHYSDKDVYMYNTLDYPVYGLAVEKIKCAYRSLYSLFDRIAYFINDYYEIGIKERDVSYRNIWMSKKTGKNGYNFDKDLKKYMTDNDTYNHPLIGLYWLYKDIGKIKVKHEYLDPSIEQISKIRNSLEHRYLKVHDIMFSPEFESSLRDTLAMSISFSELKHAAMDLLSYAREAIILLVLTVHNEEQIKDRSREHDVLIAPMYLDKYEDEWKQIFFND